MTETGGRSRIPFATTFQRSAIRAGAATRLIASSSRSSTSRAWKYHSISHFEWNTGALLPGSPAYGSWIAYGLGTENQNLPRNYHIHSVSNREFPSEDIFTKDPSDPADLVSMNGYVIDGRIHAHMTLTNGKHAFGGHLEPNTNLFTFAIVTLGVLSDNVDLTKIDDKTYR